MIAAITIATRNSIKKRTPKMMPTFDLLRLFVLSSSSDLPLLSSSSSSCTSIIARFSKYGLPDSFSFSVISLDPRLRLSSTMFSKSASGGGLYWPAIVVSISIPTFSKDLLSQDTISSDLDCPNGRTELISTTSTSSAGIFKADKSFLR